MKRNKHSLSHYRLMSMKMGFLYPCACYEVLPGDTVQHATNMLLRLSPIVAPVMHPCHVRVHHWYVPYRLLWDNWEKFITGGPDGMDASIFPTVTTNPADGSIYDYFGWPTDGVAIEGSALPLRAYNLIWNQWYRDQDLQAELQVRKADGGDNQTIYSLQPVAWEKDYFTTARPWTQKGPQVTIPLTGDGRVKMEPGGGSSQLTVQGTDGLDYAMASAGANVTQGPADTNGIKLSIDLNGISGVEVETLRKALAIQRYQEMRARYGSRYTEYLRALGVRSSDARLQRPEYLGGGKQTVQFSEVLQTGVTSDGEVGGVGNIAGHGIAAARSNRFRRFFEEHGVVISLVSVKPRTIYQQGLARMWNRRVKEDFWQPELEHIGQQEIRNKELYVLSGDQEGIFGFQDRYDEYRRQESLVTGQFRKTLNYWHMAREFAAEPVLNASFVAANPTNRIFADQTGSDTLYCMISHSIQARRFLSKVARSFIY